MEPSSDLLSMLKRNVQNMSSNEDQLSMYGMGEGLLGNGLVGATY